MKFWLFNIPFSGQKMVFFKITTPWVLRVIFVDQIPLSTVGHKHKWQETSYGTQKGDLNSASKTIYLLSNTAQSLLRPSFPDSNFPQTNFSTKNRVVPWWTFANLSTMSSNPLIFISYCFLMVSNRPFYSCMLSDLAFGWKRGWSWPCFDTDLTDFVM